MPEVELPFSPETAAELFTPPTRHDGGARPNLFIGAAIGAACVLVVLAGGFAKSGLSNAIIITGGAPQQNFALAARNIPQIDVLPVEGVNVYDIIRREKLVLTRAAVDALEARLK